MKKIAILHPDTVAGFASAFAAWHGLFVCVPPDQERPEVVPFTSRAAIMLYAPDEIVSLGIACPSPMGAPVSTIDPAIFTTPTDVWELFNPDLPVAACVGYVTDRGRWDVENSREANAYIAAMPRDFLTWFMFHPNVALQVAPALRAVALDCKTRDEVAGILSEDSLAPRRCPLRIGSFIISRFTANSVWIECEDGEGGQFSETDLSATIAKFYATKF